MQRCFLITALSFALLILLSCHKESSNEEKASTQDTALANYPFATGFCPGTSLGVSITDTSYFLPDSNDNLPDSLLLEMPPPGNQQNQTSCSAWAAVYGAGNYYNHIKNGIPYSEPNYLSPAYTYNQITKGNCSCTSILDNLYLLMTQGACTLKEMEYNPAECSIQPDSLQMSEAIPFKIKAWQKIDLHNLQFLKKAIFEKKPVLFAITTDNGFNRLGSPYIWKTRTGTTGQSHAMILMGYDESKHSFRLMNSWGTAWADHGFAWIDYDFFLNNTVSDGYLISE